MRIKRTIFSGAAVAFVVAFSVGSWAQGTDWHTIHLQDDSKWAAKSGLSVEEVAKIRSAGNVSDNSRALIDSLDARTLAAYGQVVFASYEWSARCVDFWVFAKNDNGYSKVWSSDDKGENFNFCADDKCSPPTISASANRDLKISIPAYKAGRCASSSFGFLKWTGNSYFYEGIKAASTSSKESGGGSDRRPF